MLNPFKKLALIALAFGLLSACSDLMGAIDFAQQRDDLRSRQAALQDRANSAFVAMPDSGTVVFTGDAGLSAGDSNVGVVLVGDARLSVDFGTSTVEATLGNFSGFDRREEFSDYGGTLVFEDGAIGVNRPNDLEAQIVGTLSGEDYDVNVDAFWEGDFKGTPIRGILGDTRRSRSTFDLNGAPVSGGIVIAVNN